MNEFQVERIMTECPRCDICKKPIEPAARGHLCLRCAGIKEAVAAYESLTQRDTPQWAARFYDQS